MKAAFLTFFVCLYCLTLTATAADDDLHTWQERAKHIPIGTRRTEVERLLPAFMGAASSSGLSLHSVITTKSGSGQAVYYHVTERFVAVVCYDYSGISPDASGKVINTASPNNLVTAPIQITLDPKAAK